jgi:hypothetical protein
MKMHCHKEMVEDTKNYNSEKCVHKWYYDDYSTSKHLYMLFTIPVGLQAKVICEIGFGRSTYALSCAADVLKTKVLTCDRYTYDDIEIPNNVEYIQGKPSDLYDKVKGIDFIFLDYLSSIRCTEHYCYKALKTAYSRLKENGFIAVHDSLEGKYKVAKSLKMFRNKYPNAEIITFPYGFGLSLIRKAEPSKYGKLEPKSVKKNEN